MLNEIKRLMVASIVVASVSPAVIADVVSAGAGSYTTTFPGVDRAGRNGYPTETPLVSGPAATRPVPSNDWWSSKLTNDQPNNMFNYPLGIKTMREGCGIVAPIHGQALPGDNPLTVGLEGFSATEAPTVYDYTDWTVTFAWDSADSHMYAIAGIGMPMMYFTKDSSRSVSISVAFGAVSISDNIAVVTGSFKGANYAIYAPAGATWTRSGNALVSNLDGKNYWTVALLPDNAADAAATAREWAKYAFAFPADTRAEWSYDASSGEVVTEYKVTVDHKEGSGTMLMGLLPHQWAHLKGDVTFDGSVYNTVRGELRMATTDSYMTSLKYYGILPTLPLAGSDTYGYSRDELRRLITGVMNNNGFSDWTDSYNDGQLFNRLVQTARIAREAGFTAEYESMRATIKSHLESWLTYTPGEVAFLFYYYEPWGAMLGYPAGHGQDTNLNDHHFHWGYLIHAAAFLAQDDPAWASEWGPMIDLLIRDAASTRRDDPMFPYQRAFSPYAGHCWANGTATSGPGNDQESSSESMQFHSALILWGEATGNTAVRDLGIYMYATEQSAIEEYWFDVNHRIFPADYRWMIASRVFTNGFDIENFWGGGIQGSYGIELYPIHAGSLYLIQHPAWADEFRKAIERDTPLLQNNNDPNTWHDVYWQYIAMMNAPYAIQLYNAHPQRVLKFGISNALTYQWIHSLACLGRPCRTVTADYPMTAAFDLGNTRTYAVHNYGNTPRTVRFSDGFVMEAAPRCLTTATGTSLEPWTPGEVPGNGDNPGDNDDPGTGSSCEVVDDTATEGTFVDAYTITMATEGNDVEITAKFDGEYTGPVAFLFNETQGFSEAEMTALGNQTFSGRITDVAAGSEVRFRVKLAFAGGLAVTRYITYTVGVDCDNSGTDMKLLDDSRLRVYPNPVIGSALNVAVDAPSADIRVWSASGLLMLSRRIMGTATIDVPAWPSGVYFMRVEAGNSVAVRQIVKP